MELLTRERLLVALGGALQMSGARVEISEYSRYPVPRGELEFALSGLSSPRTAQPSAPALWKGFVRYGGGRRYAVWARVRIRAPLRRVLAGENLTAGQPVRAEQLRLETVEGFPLHRSAPCKLEEVAGKVPRRTIVTGTALSLEDFEEPRAVQRGDEVAIEVESGATRLAFTGRAESAGRRGDVVSVRNVASGRNFSARVAGKGRVTLSVRKALDEKK